MFQTESIISKGSKPQTIETNQFIFAGAQILNELEMLEVVKSFENLCNLSWSFTLHFQCVAQSTFSRHGTSKQ